MKHRDPTEQLIKAYVQLLKGRIISEGETVPLGTRIPRRSNKYVLVYLESLIPYNTGDKVLYQATVTFQIVSMQATTEGDETIPNGIMEQLLELTGDPEAIIMDDFNCLTAQFEDMEPDTELTDTSYNIIRKLRMLHFIEQKQ